MIIMKYDYNRSKNLRNEKKGIMEYLKWVKDLVKL